MMRIDLSFLFPLTKYKCIFLIFPSPRIVKFTQVNIECLHYDHVYYLEESHVINQAYFSFPTCLFVFPGINNYLFLLLFA